MAAYRFTLFSSRKCCASGRISAGVELDHDAQGNLVGIDIDNASRKVQLEHLVLSRLDASGAVA